LFATANNGNCQETIDCYKYWALDHELVWSDFRGFVDSTHITQYGESPSAVSVISISYTFDYLGTALSDIKVHCVFNKELSWTKDTCSKSLLQHEQLHFDIDELYTRKIRKAIQEITTKGIADESVYKDVINSIKDEANLKNQTYDDETHTGTIEKEQERWRKMIKCELSKLSEYYIAPDLLND